MGEEHAIAAASEPRTRSTLARDLSALGVEPGMTLLMHSSLRSIGWVAGGPVAVVQALLDVLGPEGTLVVPAHSSGNSEPSNWRRPPVPASWWPVIRAEMPAFDRAVTPSRAMGAIAECARTWPGARRSGHPSDSFAAFGPLAARVCGDDWEGAYDDGLGERSPLARVYDLDGSVLLLGVPHGNNTSLHLAEYRAAEGRAVPRVQAGAAVLARGRREWRTFTDLELHDELFDELGGAFDATGATRRGLVGSAECRLLRQRQAVDFAVGWLRRRDEPAG